MDIFDICHWKTRSYDLGKGQKRVIYFIVSFGIYNLLKSGLNRIKVGCVLTMVVSILAHAEFVPNDHREDSLHFILLMDEYDRYNLIKIVTFKILSMKVILI